MKTKPFIVWLPQGWEETGGQEYQDIKDRAFANAKEAVEVKKGDLCFRVEKFQPIVKKMPVTLYAVERI
jgi:hypothetical protein